LCEVLWRKPLLAPGWFEIVRENLEPLWCLPQTQGRMTRS
jgi:hypothetical protein